MLTVIQSRTTVGLLIVLVVACSFSLLDKLTPELADILKWAFGLFAMSRTVTNVAETRATKAPE